MTVAGAQDRSRLAFRVGLALVVCVLLQYMVFQVKPRNTIVIMPAGSQQQQQQQQPEQQLEQQGDQQQRWPKTAPLVAHFPTWWWSAQLEGSEKRCGKGISCLEPADGELVESIDTAAKNKKKNSVFRGMRSEDRYLYETLFYGLANGTFLEMGAVDGIGQSNSLFFARRLGWSGLLIEADPVRLPRLVANRPESVSINTAVCSDFSEVHYWRSMKGPTVGGIMEFMAPAFIDRWYPKGPNGKRKWLAEELAVTCVPLAYVLDCVGMHTFDFFSLDVEGAELEVLKTLDFSRVHFGVIIVELDGRSPRKDKEVISLLTSHGYEVFFKDNKNTVFTGPGFQPTSKP